MIARLTGSIVLSGAHHVVLDVGGVGYKIGATLETIRKTAGKKDVTLFTHLAVREDALDLYGFLDASELSFFELLIGISGIGPKTAIGILNVAPAETIRKAISSGDSSYLTKVSGIGRKTAEKIMLELKDKFGAVDAGGATVKEEVEAIEALQSLGYTLSEARTALKNVPENASTEERIKHALKKLS